MKPSRFHIWFASVLLVLAICSHWVPLASDLHYEFAAFVALGVSLFAGLLSLTVRDRDGDGKEAPDLSDRRWGRLRDTLVFCCIPLLYGVLRALLTDPYGMGEGILWFLLLVPVSAVLSTALAAFVARLVQRRWLRVLLFVLVWSLSLLRGAYEAYTGPHIFMYAWQIGFFPGGSWDAELSVSSTLVAYQVFHVLLGVSLLAVLDRLDLPGKSVRRSFGSVGIALLIVCGAVAFAYRPQLGLTRTETWLREQLGDSLRTKYATIYYKASEIDSLDIWRAVNYTDFYISEHAQALNITTDTNQPVIIHLYATPEEQKQLVGTNSASFTKPWLRTVNIAVGRIDGSLKHELAHVMMAQYGNPLGISNSQGLVEGSAMALENDYGWRTLHQYAAMMYHYKMAPPAKDVISITGFSSQNPSLSYVLSGSFSKWLIDTYGIAKYTKAFAWSRIESTYGKSLEQLSGEYQRFIDTIPLPDSNYIVTMKYLFGGGSFFAQKSLRRIGTLNARAGEALGNERYNEALKLYSEAQSEGGGYGTREGILRTLYTMGDWKQLLDSCRSYDRDTANYRLLPFLIERGDACWALGDTVSARRYYDSVTTLDLNPSLNLRALLRRFFLRADTSVKSIMQTYFVGRRVGLMQRMMLLEDALRALKTDTVSFYPIVLKLMRATLMMSKYPISAIEQLLSTASTRDVMAMIAADSTLIPIQKITELQMLQLRDGLLAYEQITKNLISGSQQAEMFIQPFQVCAWDTSLSEYGRIGLMKFDGAFLISKDVNKELPGSHSGVVNYVVQQRKEMLNFRKFVFSRSHL